MTFDRHAVPLAVLLAFSGAAFAQAKGETVKIAWIDPLSGLMAPVGQNMLKTFQFFAEKFNNDPRLNPSGVKFELVTFDNKLSPSETLNALKSATDQGIRYVVQGAGSSAALALSDAVAKFNERNPGREVLYINYAAVDPDLTNSKCNYWHFRVDADTSMKMEALSTFLKEQKAVSKVYLINQNYTHGHQVSRYAKDTLARKRPDVQIVGDDVHPLAQVRDFAPYVAKIKASGADTVITGNWGSDLALLVKSANETGLNVNFYTYYASLTGGPTAIGAAGAGKVFEVSTRHSAMGGDVRKYGDEFKSRFNDDWSHGPVFHAYALLAQAIAKAKSVDPGKVAAAMEGLKFKSYSGEVEMRRADHQLQQPLWISVWQKADAKLNYSVENTGLNFQPVKVYDAYVSSTPTSCQMKRPG